MSTVKVRVVFKETLLYVQNVEMAQEDFEELKEGIPFTKGEIWKMLDLSDVAYCHADIQEFAIAEEAP